jgi:hypothetical protein
MRQRALRKIVRCGVRAGDASVITCRNVTSCEVECLGTCQVTCADANPCAVTCPMMAAPLSCANGTLACGQC